MRDDRTSFRSEGATNPEYVVTADDVGVTISAERIPMDDRGNQDPLELRIVSLDDEKRDV
ncbi:hypothetical protein QJS10_CPA01g00499 [Acorus calamus]|uniref:Uncharacterized protein n=1 Tax=Acorus calamus TaxID=4465 RepID=A0AAV9FVA0_ACOCL|nr:hypothetical protein QJS10_CPA01g00499 [Acorus calamus]